jgi:hypothetical protein
LSGFVAIFVNVPISATVLAKSLGVSVGTEQRDPTLALGCRTGGASRKEAIMARASRLISPLDAEYAERREAEERRRETREWLEKRERELGFVKDAPSVAPGKSGN